MPHQDFNTAIGALSTPLPIGEATLFIGFERSDAEGFGEASIQRLSLLVPAFAAGVRVHQQFASQQAALAGVADALQQAVALYSPRGALLHRSYAWGRLLADERESNDVQRTADGLAEALCVRWKARTQAAADASLQIPSACVRTAGGRYRLRASYAPPEAFGREGVLVLLERDSAGLPTRDEIQQRFGLTRREAEAADLLARGYTDKAMARELSVSRHTARNYTERVLAKLRVHSRSLVTLKLLEQGEEASAGAAAEAVHPPMDAR